MSELFDEASEKYITDHINKDLSEDAYITCYNLSSILGDTSDGKLSQTATKSILKALDITSPGIVILGEVESDQGLQDMNMPIQPFNNKISPQSYSLYSKLRLSDDSVTTTLSSKVAPIVVLSSTLTPVLKNSISSILIESLWCYQEILEGVVSNILETDITRIDSNIRWCTAKLEQLPIKPFELIIILRKLQRTICHIRFLKVQSSEQLSSNTSWHDGGVYVG